jgi:hypothetical protein
MACNSPMLHCFIFFSGSGGGFSIRAMMPNDPRAGPATVANLHHLDELTPLVFHLSVFHCSFQMAGVSKWRWWLPSRLTNTEELTLPPPRHYEHAGPEKRHSDTCQKISMRGKAIKACHNYTNHSDTKNPRRHANCVACKKCCV